MKSLCRHQLDLFMFNELWECCCQQWALAVTLQRATYCLGNSLSCFGISMGTFCHHLNWMKPSLGNRTLFGDKRSLCLHPYLETSLGLISYIVGKFHCTMFPYKHSNTLNLAIFTDISSLNIILPPPSYLTLFLFPHTSSSPPIKSFFSSPSQGGPFVPLSSFLYT